MSEWFMRGHFRHLRFKTFWTVYITPQGPHFGSVNVILTLLQRGVATHEPEARVVIDLMFILSKSYVFFITITSLSMVCPPISWLDPIALVLFLLKCHLFFIWFIWHIMKNHLLTCGSTWFPPKVVLWNTQIFHSKFKWSSSCMTIMKINESCQQKKNQVIGDWFLLQLHCFLQNSIAKINCYT